MRCIYLPLFAVLVLVSSCASKRPVHPVDSMIAPPSAVVWREYKTGIELASYEIDDPPLRAWMVAVDLGNPGLEVMVTPGTPGEGGSEVVGRYTELFAREFDLDLAVNASPFYPVIFGFGTPQWVAGLSVSEGELYSRPGDRYAALLFRTQADGGYQAEIVQPAREDGLEGVSEAAGGFFQVLKDGIDVAPEVDSRYPMTLAGLDEDGGRLILLVVDGRQPYRSVGLTPREGAVWLRALGCSDGMYFDGGGSTTLVIRGDDGEHEVVNRPVDARVLHKQRVVANHLGFRISEME